MKQADLSRHTKEALAASLKKFMLKKSLDKITVREIIEDCGVNRQTFYYHFHDIYDLLTWMFEQEAVELVRRGDSCLTWEDGVSLFFRYIEENAAICECALDGLGLENLRRFFHSDAEAIMRSIVNELADDRNIPEDYIEFLCDFYIEAFVSVAIHWLREGRKTPSEKLLHYLKITVEGSLKAALLRAEADGWDSSSPTASDGGVPAPLQTREAASSKGDAK